MKKNILFLAIIITTTLSLFSQSQKQMVITIDDLPVITRIRGMEVKKTVTKGILTALTKHKAPGIGFVNENKLETNGKVDPEKVTLLEEWLEAGMDLGNHAYSHPDLNRISLENYEKDILKGEKITKELLEKKGMKMRYFRHPFLHAGNTTEKKTGLEAFLKENSYQPAPVTIDNSEWIFAAAYDKALMEKDEKMQLKLGGAYLAYMEAKIAFYEGQTQKLFQREIPQILLIHANTINRDYLDDLLQMISDRGYSFISLEDALKDAAYDSKDDFIGRAGITWLDRWAITRKMPKAHYRGEPPAPKFVQQYAGIEE